MACIGGAAETFSLLAAAHPSVFDSRQPALVHPHHPRRAVPRPQHARMVDSNHREPRHRNRQPPRRNQMRAKRAPRHRRDHDRQQQANISEADMQFFQTENYKFARLQPPPIFLGRPVFFNHRGYFSRLWFFSRHGLWHATLSRLLYRVLSPKVRAASQLQPRNGTAIYTGRSRESGPRGQTACIQRSW